MPILGPATYSPSAQFAITRPYVHQFTFGFGPGVSITNTDGNFYATDTISGIIHVVCNLLPEFWATSSNRYTMDFIIVDWWILIDPSPAPIAFPLTLTWQHDPVTHKPELFLYLVDWTTRYTFALPPAPPGYWTPT